MFDQTKVEDYQAMVKAYEDNGATIVKEFEGQVRAGGEQMSFAKDDVIEWPKTLQIIKQPIRNSVHAAYGFIVKVTSKNGGTRFTMFYPSSLTKTINRRFRDSEGKLLDKIERVRPGGEAAQEFQSMANQSLDASVRKFIADHKNGLKVTRSEIVECNKFQSMETATAMWYDFDFA